MSKTFVLAPDSFKESLSAKEVCRAMEKGIRKVFPDANIISLPMADGGEGTVDALLSAVNGQKVDILVDGSLENQIVHTYYGLIEDGKTAVIEMAKANGLELLSPNERNPLLSSTFGTGQMMKDAFDKGVEKMIIAIGGSATNDGGAGMAQALGAKLLDRNNQEIARGGGNLSQLEQIDLSQFDKRLLDIEVLIACDVTNTLVSPNGASHVFGAQKGASPEMIELLDANLTHFADVILKDLNKDIKDMSGAGAAGGLGGGLFAFSNAKMVPGIDLMIEFSGLEDKVKEADYVFTGEGGMDFQTKFGKVPYGVAKTAKKHQKPVMAMAGYIGKDVDVLYDEGITAIFGILAKAQSVEEALLDGAKNIERTAENISRLLAI